MLIMATGVVFTKKMLSNMVEIYFLAVISEMFINIYKPLLEIGWKSQMLLTMLEIHVEFSMVP